MSQLKEREVPVWHPSSLTPAENTFAVVKVRHYEWGIEQGTSIALALFHDNKWVFTTSVPSHPTVSEVVEWFGPLYM